jgi:SAM-dependent methyltransferase
MNYRLAYAIGFHPWEDLAEHPPFAGKLLELIAREEDGDGPPYGRALDLGTGSAVWGVQLAQRGWDVTCVDIVEKALRRARERADQAGAEVRLVHADVTALREAGLSSGFRLLLDTGTFHGLTYGQREAMGREVSAVAAPDASLILDCFAPRRRGPLPAGASRADVERAFPGWEITDVEVADTAPDALARFMKFDERFYRLRRTVEARRAGRGYAEQLEAIAPVAAEGAGRDRRGPQPPMTVKDTSAFFR